MAVEYNKPSKEAAEQAIKESNRSGGGDGGSDITWWYPGAEGVHKFRILPPWDEQQLLGMKVAKHKYLPAEEDGETRKHVCVEKTWPERNVTCPVCEVLREAEHRGVDISKYEPQTRAYMNALVLETANDRLDASPDNPAQVLMVHTEYTLTWLYEKWTDPDYDDIISPINGYIIKITCTGNRGSDYYKRDVVPKSGPLVEDEDGEPDEEAIQEIIDNMHQIDEVYNFPPDDVWETITESAKQLANQLVGSTDVVTNAFGGTSTSSGPSPSARPSDTAEESESEEEAEETEEVSEEEPEADAEESSGTKVVETEDEDETTPPPSPEPEEEEEPPLPEPWQEHHSEEHGQDYYYNPETEETQWERPEPEPKAPAGPPTPPPTNSDDDDGDEEEEDDDESSGAGSSNGEVSKEELRNAEEPLTGEVYLRDQLEEAGVEVPDDAPRCFGDEEVYDPVDDPCLMCIFDAECTDAQEELTKA